jgi:hypothetical protein
MLTKTGESRSSRCGLVKAGGGALLFTIGFGVVAFLLRTAGGVASLLKRTREVHLEVDLKAKEKKNE